jgi:putative selenium metabolism protein SsnA
MFSRLPKKAKTPGRVLATFQQNPRNLHETRGGEFRPSLAVPRPALESLESNPVLPDPVILSEKSCAMGTVFRNAMLVQLDPPRVEVADLRQEGGRIVAIGKNVAAESKDETVDCGSAVLMPGLVNGHTHLYSALAAGMPAPPRAPTNFHEILKFIWWRLDRAHTLASVRTSGIIGALAAVRCGTTTLIDHHASPEVIAGRLTALEEGIEAVGCRAVMCFEVTCRNRKVEAQEGLAENERYIRLCQQRGDGKFAALVGAHASFTLDDESLAACVDLAKRLGVGMHIHAAEDPIDERITRERFGCELMQRFHRMGLLELPGTIFAHGTHFSDYDRAVIYEREYLSLAHNPSSNMNNGVGYMPALKFPRPTLLGTDGIGADMIREARVTEFKSHDAGMTLRFGWSLKMLGESARFASQALGVKLGVLEVGAAADLVLTNYRPATPLTSENVAGHFIYAMGPEYVRDVMIDGWWVLRNGHVVTCDEPRERAAAVEVSAALHQRMALIPCE